MLQTRTFNYASSFNYGYEYATNLGTLNIDDQAIFNTIMDDWEEVLAVDFESTMVSPELVIMEGDIDGDRGILGFVHYLDDGTNLLVGVAQKSIMALQTAFTQSVRTRLVMQLGFRISSRTKMI